MNYAVKLFRETPKSEITVSEIMEMPKSAVPYAKKYATRTGEQIISYSTLEKAKRGREHELYLVEIMKTPKEELMDAYRKDYKFLRSVFSVDKLRRMFQFPLMIHNDPSYRLIARVHFAAQIVQRHYDAMKDDLSELLEGSGIGKGKPIQKPKVP